MFANPLGLLALLALPAVVGLHLFRRRFRPREVSALFLWGDEDRTPLSGRRRDRLRATGSLACECLAALLLALLLSGPRGCDGAEGLHLVAVLDGSASMDAVQADGRTARGRALEEVRARIEALPRGSRVSLVVSGPRPRTLAGPAAYPEEARDALGGWRPTAARHELTPALALGLQLAGGGRVLLATDRFQPDEVPPQVELVATGAPLDNVALAAAARAPAFVDGARRERVFVTLASFAEAPRTVQVSLLAEDGAAVLAPRAVTLAPGAREPLAFDLPADAPAVEVRLSPDALAIDDHAFLAPRPPRVVGVASDLDEATRRALGLDGADGAPLARLAGLDPECVVAPSPAAAHVLLSRAVGGAASTWCLVLAPAPDAGARKDFIGPFLAERRHPLLEGTTLEGVVWSADPALALPGTPLVSAGNLPLLTEEREAARRVLRLDLDPARSSLARSPDWPILLANLVAERRRELPGAEATNLTTGGTLTWRAALAPGDDAPFVLRGPERRREHPARAVVVFDEVDEPGFHALERRGARLAVVGVSFQDAAESDLRALSSGRRAAEVEDASSGAGGSRLELALLAAILALALVDWILLERAGAGVAAPRGAA